MKKVGGTRFGHNMMDLVVPPPSVANHCHIRSLFEDRDSVNWMMSIWFSGAIKEIHSLVKFSAEDCDFVWDHSDYSTKIALDAGLPRRPAARFVAMARSPSTIAMSDYFYRHRQSYDWHQKSWGRIGSEEKILDVLTKRRNQGELRKWLSGCSSLSIKCGSIGMPKPIESALCSHHHTVCHSDSIQFAVANRTVDTAFMIGLTEAMDSAICLLFKLLHDGLTHLDCNQLFTASTDRTNETPAYKHLLQTTAISNAIHDAVHPHDQLLYDRVKRRFINECKQFNVALPQHITDELRRKI